MCPSREVKDLRINDRSRTKSRQKIRNVLRSLDLQFDDRFFGIECHMRRGQKIRRAQQGMVRREPFGFKDIQPRTRNPTILQREQQRNGERRAEGTRGDGDASDPGAGREECDDLPHCGRGS